MGENSKDRLSFLLDSYLQGREDSTELLYGGRSAAQRQDDTSGAIDPSGKVGAFEAVDSSEAVDPFETVDSSEAVDPSGAVETSGNLATSCASDISGALEASGNLAAFCTSDISGAVETPDASGAVGNLGGLSSRVSVETGSSQRDRVLSILDDFLEEAGVDSDVLELGMPAQDYVRNFLENLPDVPVTGLEKDIRDKTGRLLDAFLSAGSENLNIGCDALRNVSAGAGDSLNGEGEIESDYSDDSDDSGLDGRANHFEEAFFTETLAEIFMKQHRYDKALEIIRSLYLNFPNKSIYFADQIRYLEKLIRINQISK